jgi:XTP/dITP diphosphohydrolase
MQLVFATHNKHKVSEIQFILPNSIKLLTLEDIGCSEEIPETADTLSGNALQKAMFVYEKYKCNCFADDTGLEIKALDGRPGVYSARYAGEGKSAEDNMVKVLEEMEGVINRSAIFKTVIALLIDGKPMLFEGNVKGAIAIARMGDKGFGYDPIFIPEGEQRSFAQMTADEKNKISHRARAVKKFVEYVNRLA